MSNNIFSITTSALSRAFRSLIVSIGDLQHFFILLLCLLSTQLCAQKNKKTEPSADTSIINKQSSAHDWKLIFSDGFNKNGNFDESKWSYCPRSGSPWSRFLTPSPNYAFVDDGKLILKMDDAGIDGDNVPYHSGGVQTSAKFSLQYGKVEVRARFKDGKGSWPAIWMMPEKPVAYGSWPNSGEIDIMEHLNYELTVHQTIHNGSVTDSNGGSSATHQTAFRDTGYNTYGIIWNPAAIRFYVNNELTYTYTKPKAADFRGWPFDRPFYIILNQSGGVGWPGPANKADLPFVMEVDWVRVYN